MTAKRFELKIPPDLFQRIEEAARDYFKSPKNHTSKKPELTSPILKLIEKGLEKIASSPDTDTNQFDTDRLNALIDEKIKAHLSVYKLDDLQASINNLEQVVFSSLNRTDSPVSNPDKDEIVTPDDIPDSRGNGSKLFSVELDQTATVDDTDRKDHPCAREGEDKGDKRVSQDKETLKSSNSPISSDSSKSIDLSGVIKTQIEPVLNPGKSEISDPLEFMDNHNTHERNSTDNVPAISVEKAPIDDGNQKAIEDASYVWTTLVYSPDTTSNDTTPGSPEITDTLLNKLSAPTDNSCDEGISMSRKNVAKAAGGLEKSFAPGAKITLKGAWKHALLIGFTGTMAEFRSLFYWAGDVHYGVKLVYKSNAGASRNYEINQ
jgi:hypothetical protein